jgi:hypothetical protein
MSRQASHVIPVGSVEESRKLPKGGEVLEAQADWPSQLNETEPCPATLFFVRLGSQTNDMMTIAVCWSSISGLWVGVKIWPFGQRVRCLSHKHLTCSRRRIPCSIPVI